jgi:hypothetical protein
VREFLVNVYLTVVCRFDAQTGADREVQRILLELLNQMDGFDQTTNVKVGTLPYRLPAGYGSGSALFFYFGCWIPDP